MDDSANLIDMDEIIKGLNEKQVEAVKIMDGPVLVSLYT